MAVLQPHMTVLQPPMVLLFNLWLFYTLAVAAQSTKIIDETKDFIGRSTTNNNGCIHVLVVQSMIASQSPIDIPVQSMAVAQPPRDTAAV